MGKWYENRFGIKLFLRYWTYMLNLKCQFWYLPQRASLARVGSHMSLPSIKIVLLLMGVRGVFFRGGKVIFPDFFPSVKCFFLVGISHFGTPKTNFSGFEKWKKKKKKKKKGKKKGPLLIFHFVTFPTSVFNFPPSLSRFSFSSPFSLFLLPSFSRWVSRDFLVISVRGHSAPWLLCHCCYVEESLVADNASSFDKSVLFAIIEGQNTNVTLQNVSENHNKLVHI